MAAYELDPQARLTLELLGHPENFGQGSLQAAESTVVRCASDVIAVGLGAHEDLFESITAETKTITFKDRTGALVSRRY